MFAVIKTGGKQYTVKKDEFIQIEKLEIEAGNTVEFNEVLLVGEDEKVTKVGAPTVKGAVVTAEVIDQKRDDKIIIFKKKRRQGYRRTQGHRQDVTIVRITDIKSA